MPQTGWYQAKNRRATRRILMQLAERYGTSSQLWGIELLNTLYQELAAALAAATMVVPDNWLVTSHCAATTRISICDTY